MNELLERARNAWDNLSSREQLLVGAAGAMLAVALVVSNRQRAIVAALRQVNSPERAVMLVHHQVR